MALAKRKPEFDFTHLRDEMVEHHIAARGVRSECVLKAMRKVKREAFLPADLQEFAYEDSPLPIAEGQTISQPYIVALMVEALALEGGERVLEIGTGSGYAAAVLAEIARDVYTVERIGQLRKKRLRRSPSKATRTCTCCTATARAAGPSTRLMTPSWSRPAGRRFRNRCARNSRSAAGW